MVPQGTFSLASSIHLVAKKNKTFFNSPNTCVVRMLFYFQALKTLVHPFDRTPVFPPCFGEGIKLNV